MLTRKKNCDPVVDRCLSHSSRDEMKEGACYFKSDKHWSVTLKFFKGEKANLMESINELGVIVMA